MQKSVEFVGKMNKHIILLSISLLTGIIMIIGSVSAADLYVDATYSGTGSDGSEKQPYVTLADAIAAAQPYDTIIIQPGIYYESVILSKPLTLLGSQKDYCILDGSNNSVVLTITSDNVTISNLTFRYATIAINTSKARDVEMYNCTFNNNIIGINIDASSTVQITQNNFISNTESAKDASNDSQWSLDGQGNYWDTYLGTDANNDGIGDTSYSNDEGVIDSAPSMQPITRAPLVSFSLNPTNPFTNTLVSMQDDSMDPDGWITQKTWMITKGTQLISSGGTTDITDTFDLYTFTDNGVYTITLTVYDNYNVSSSASVDLTVLNTPPTASFYVEPGSPTDIDDVVFVDTSTDSDGTIVNWTWYFSENITKYGATCTFQFPDNGTYTVQLAVKDDDGAVSTSTKTIQVRNVAPSASFNYFTDNVTAFVNDPIQFADTSNDPDGSIVRWSWNFGDGSTSTEKHTTHTYSQKGSYKVTLTVVDNDGASSTYTQHITLSGTYSAVDGETGPAILDYIFIVFIVVIVIVVIVISKKYAK